MTLLACTALVAAACAGSDASEESATTDAAPVVTESVDTEPVDAEAEPVDTEPEPVDTEPVDTEPEPVDTEPVDTEPVDTEPEPRSYDFSAVAPIVDEFVAANELNGAGLVVVEADDGIVHEYYAGEFTPDRVSLIASSSKSVSAGVLLRLADDGLLDMNAPISDIVDWGDANPGITPAQLVSNSSGLVGLGGGLGIGSYSCQYIFSESLQECAEQIFTTPDDDGDVIAPDSEFRYGGAQWTVAGAVAEAASGKTWNELVNEFFVQPCGMDSFAFNNHFAQMGSGFDYPVDFNGDPSTLAPTENPNPEGGAYTNAVDYGDWLLMQLQGGFCGDDQVLSQDALDAMHGDRIGEVYDGAAGGESTGYGMGWWVDRESGRITDPGAYGAFPWLDLGNGFGAYVIVEATTATGSELADELFQPVEDAVLTART